MRVLAPLQPGEKMIQVGITELLANLPGLEDSDIDEEQLSDAVVFVWQAMYAEIK